MLRYLVLGSAMVVGLASTASAAPTGTDSSTTTMPPGEYNTIPTDRTTVNAQKKTEPKKTDATEPGAVTPPSTATTTPPPNQTQPMSGQESSPPPHN